MPISNVDDVPTEIAKKLEIFALHSNPFNFQIEWICNAAQ